MMMFQHIPCERCQKCLATQVAWLPDMSGGFTTIALCYCPECQIGGGGAVLKKLMEGTTPVYKDQ